MLFRPEKPRKKSQRGNIRTIQTREMSPRSDAITATRKGIMQSIVPNRKTSKSLGYLHGLENAFSTFDTCSSLGQ